MVLLRSLEELVRHVCPCAEKALQDFSPRQSHHTFLDCRGKIVMRNCRRNLAPMAFPQKHVAFHVGPKRIGVGVP